MIRDSGVFNFAAGPAALPPEVLERARAELPDWQGQGYSLLETPFTSDAFTGLMTNTRNRLRRLLGLPDNYHILFFQGGASAQFSLVPLNLLPHSGTAGYVDTGHWSVRARQEGSRYGLTHLVASSGATGFDRIPEVRHWSLPDTLAYCHITPNETANGVQFQGDPDCGDIPLVADMTSEFLSRPINIERYGLIYAGTQKNLGPPGLVVIVIRDDLLNRARKETPTVFNYGAQQRAGNRINTPLMFSIYLVNLMLEWLERSGGTPAAQARSIIRSQHLYALIDEDDFYRCPIQPGYRSVMNVCFGVASDELRQRFLEQAAASGLLNLSGHSCSGGLRASLYNAQPEAAATALADFMSDFRRRCG